MRPKGAKGGSTSPQGQVGPKPQVGKPEPILAPNVINPKMAKKDPRTRIGQEPPFGLWKPPEATSSGSERLTLNSREDLSFTIVPHTKGSRCGAYLV
ncbi:hypothetical protein O181_058560 [Austropuccinia psidii MF-1]|uniref:Uncharacterized protein n=1 Tax=Austropuccinia psidii MF-1 TaxID=1389203 RepID=A0A9Q3HXZ0_9BASI|nr:hypothetical protein [Austropuccinia psidii MF-1]